jgi:hypothetical protein
MTGTSYRIFGGWGFEANAFIPGHLWWPISLSIIYIVIGSFYKSFAYTIIFLRTVAVATHVMLWIQCAFSVPDLSGRATVDWKLWILSIGFQVIILVALWIARNDRIWNAFDGTYGQEEPSHEKWGRIPYDPEGTMVYHEGKNYGNIVQHEDENIIISIKKEYEHTSDYLRNFVSGKAKKEGVYYIYENYYIRFATEKDLYWEGLKPLKTIVNLS